MNASFCRTGCSWQGRQPSIADVQVSDLTEADIIAVEADAYWSLCKLLDSIQDHYTYAQPGIQRAVFHLKELVR